MQAIPENKRIEAHLLWMAYLSPGQLKRIQLVCKEWRNIVPDNRIWNSVCRWRNIGPDSNDLIGFSWHDFYHLPATQLHLQCVGLLDTQKIRKRLEYPIKASCRPLVACLSGKDRVIAVDRSGRVVALSPFRKECIELLPSVQGSPVTSFQTFQWHGESVHVHGDGVLPGEHRLQESQLKGGAHSSSYGPRVPAERLAASAPREGAIPREHVRESCLAVARENHGITIINLDRRDGGQCNFWTTGRIENFCVLEERNGQAAVVFEDGQWVARWRVPENWDVAEPKVSAGIAAGKKRPALYKLERDNSVIFDDGERLLQWDPLAAGVVHTLFPSPNLSELQGVRVGTELHLLGRDGDQIKHWNLSLMQPSLTFHTNEPKTVTAWLAIGGSKSGRLYVAREDGRFLQWSITPARFLGSTSPGELVIQAMLLMTIGPQRLLVTGCRSGFINIRNATSGKMCAKFQASGPVKQLISIPTRHGPVYLGIVCEDGTFEVRDFPPPQ